MQLGVILREVAAAVGPGGWEGLQYRHDFPPLSQVVKSKQTAVGCCPGNSGIVASLGIPFCGE